jgi:hypothetical protein
VSVSVGAARVGVSEGGGSVKVGGGVSVGGGGRVSVGDGVGEGVQVMNSVGVIVAVEDEVGGSEVSLGLTVRVGTGV